MKKDQEVMNKNNEFNVEEDMPNLQALYDRGVANGVKDLKILSKEEVLKLEPNITDEVVAALYAPTAGIVCPFNMNIALAENANVKNLITGTRYFNETTMLPFEIMVMEYLDHSDNHVLYRVSPYFKGDELVARGVEIEAYSVEDRGKGLCFHVFVYNHQPGIYIDYRTGENRIE